METALGKPGFFTTISLGGERIKLSSLIGECKMIDTDNGKIYLHPTHGKGERAENLEFARWRAEAFGEEVILLPNPQGVKTPDSYNITRGVMEEYKVVNKATKTAIDNALRGGSKQASHILMDLSSNGIKGEDIVYTIKSRINRTNIQQLRIRLGDYEAVYNRADILSPNFKIQPSDFRNTTVTRRRGTSLNEQITDAKVADFFGLNKKTVKEIAAERHAARDAASIQKAWNERRIANNKKRADNLLRIDNNRRAYERLMADPNYKDVEFNPENGGLKAIHIEHENHSSVSERKYFLNDFQYPAGLSSTDLELRCQDVLFHKGYSCILESEHIYNPFTGKQLTSLDTTTNGMRIDIRSITENNANTIRNGIIAKKKQLRKFNELNGTSYDSIILYFHNPSFYNENVIRLNIGETIKRIIVVFRDGSVKEITEPLK